MVGDGREGSRGQSLKILVVLGERFPKHREDSWRWGGNTRGIQKSPVRSAGPTAPGWVAPNWVALEWTAVGVALAHALPAACVLMSCQSPSPVPALYAHSLWNALLVAC